jgi:Peptidase M15
MTAAARRGAIMAALALGLGTSACGASAPQAQSPARAQPPARTATQPPAPPFPQAHPQAIQPVAGAQAAVAGDARTDPVGDVKAHARPLASVKRELQQLNMCGGAVNSSQAQPVVIGAGPGFVADPGTQQAQGQLPQLTAQLNALARSLGITIYGISGYRTPGHSVAVGGFANDPHTRGEAEDIGVNSLLRSSAAQISEADLARFGLYRPFDPTDDPNNTEVNHIQLIPIGGPLSVAEASSVFDPDPSCK